MTRNISNSNPSHDDHLASLDADARAVHVALDQDAALRRAEPDAQFEHRIAVASFGGLMSSPSEATPPIAGRITGGFTNAKRLAAAIALIATAGAAWLALRPSSNTPSPFDSTIAHNQGGSTQGERTPVAVADPADDLIALATTIDDSTGAEIDALFADTVRVESNIHGTESLFGGNISMDGGDS